MKSLLGALRGRYFSCLFIHMRLIAFCMNLLWVWPQPSGGVESEHCSSLQLSDQNAFDASVENFRGINTSQNENKRGTDGDRNSEKGVCQRSRDLELKFWQPLGQLPSFRTLFFRGLLNKTIFLTEITTSFSWSTYWSSVLLLPHTEKCCTPHQVLLSHRLSTPPSLSHALLTPPWSCPTSLGRSHPSQKILPVYPVKSFILENQTLETKGFISANRETVQRTTPVLEIRVVVVSSFGQWQKFCWTTERN